MSDFLDVEYLQGSVTIKRKMTQIELSELLKEDVLLLFVNKPKFVHIKRKPQREKETN